MSTWDGLNDNERRVLRLYGFSSLESAESLLAVEIYRSGFLDGLEATAEAVTRAVEKVVAGIVAGEIVPRSRPRPIRGRRVPPTAKKADLIAALRAEIAEASAGDWLGSEAQLVKDYRLSRTTVREALKVLEAEGLIASHNGKGRYVL